MNGLTPSDDPVTISVRLTRVNHSHIFYEWRQGAIEPLRPGELPHRVVPFGFLGERGGAQFAHGFAHGLASGFADAVTNGVAIHAMADEIFPPAPRIPPEFLAVEPGNVLGPDHAVYRQPQVTMDRRLAWLTMTFTHTGNHMDDFVITRMSTNLHVHLPSIMAATPAYQRADAAWDAYFYNMELFALLAAAMIQDERSLTVIPGPILLGGGDEDEWDSDDEEPQPVSQAALDALPTRQIADDEETESCVVCLDAMSAGERVAVLRCGHVFHVECVKEWLAVSGTCPVCRYVV